MALSPDPQSPLPDPFDPTSAVVFELNKGRVQRAEGQPVVLVTAAALADLCSTLDSAQLMKFGSALGRAAGASLKAKNAQNASWTLPQVVQQLGGEISLGGLGSLAMERWGEALVVQMEGCPLGTSGPAAMGAYIEAALQALFARKVNAVTVDVSGGSFRLLLCGRQAAGQVQRWIASGKSFAEAMASLQTPSTQGAN